jgi:hypothetical protein
LLNNLNVSSYRAARRQKKLFGLSHRNILVFKTKMQWKKWKRNQISPNFINNFGRG